ncbi:MAG: hypothetical protein FD123_428 [Bacteroidetes bacterium]|nr:MAG: hypothetical protein FD123_428 [Bacteroidota bacterium]
MATKKKEETPVTNSNINTNNNTNNINLNVKVEQPKPDRRSPSPPKKKPNWVVKTIVIGIIGLVLSLLGVYLKRTLDGGHGSVPGVHSEIANTSKNDFT